jgi:threonine dehydrogenase-like Zn-dependent dehydrogenase
MMRNDSKMCALGMRELGRPEILEVPRAPPPGEGEVRVAMEMIALSVAEMRACRGDRFRHFRQTIDPASPFVFGFAGVGRIETSADRTIEVGQQVVLSGLDACGRCEYCRQGLENHCVQLKLSGIDADAPGFGRELVTIAARRVFPLPDDFPLPRACVVSEVATAIHALQQARLGFGEAFGVVGAGRHGRQIIRVAKRWGAHPIIAVDPALRALELAQAAGANVVVLPEDRPDHSLDVVVHANSEETSLGLCCDLAGPRGRVVLLGTPRNIDVDLPRFRQRVVERELELIATDSKNPPEYRTAIELMASGGEDWEVRDPDIVSMAAAPAILERSKSTWPLERDVYIRVASPVRAGGAA